MGETIDGLIEKFRKWNYVFESKDFKVSLEKTKVMGSRVITKDIFSKSKVYLFNVHCLTVMFH